MKKKNKALNISQKLKFRKPSKRVTNVAINHFTYKYSKSHAARFVVQAASDGRLTPNQIEAMRVSLRRPIKYIKKSKVTTLHKPKLIVTKRSAGIRMGRGKGGPSFQVSLISKGQLLYEVSGPSAIRMFNVFTRSRKKLPVRLNLVDLKNGKIA